MILRTAGALLIALAVTGCAGVPAAVVWTTVGAGLTFGAEAAKFDVALIEYVEGREKGEQPAKP